MRSPSPPKRPAKYSVMCELGHRLYSDNFMEKGDAAAFVQAVLQNEPLRWESPEEATAKGGVLVIKADDLEDLVEMERVPSLSSEQLRAVKAFLSGHWPPNDKVPGSATSTNAKKAVMKKPGLVTLADMCTRNKWTPRVARMKLRKAKVKRPKDAGWAWPSNEAAKIEKQLKELI